MDIATLILAALELTWQLKRVVNEVSAYALFLSSRHSKPDSTQGKSNGEILEKLLLEIHAKISNLQGMQRSFSDGRAANRFSTTIANTVEYVQ